MYHVCNIAFLQFNLNLNYNKTSDFLPAKQNKNTNDTLDFFENNIH